jgi:hypothetical protein
MTKPVLLSSNVVVLSETEMWKCERLAHARHDPKVGVVTDKAICDSPGLELNLLGVMSEYAVSLYFREPMDLFIDLSGDGNVTDLVIGNLTASVKCIRKRVPPQHLIFNDLEEFRQDVAILTLFTAPNVIELLGWITPARFRELHKRHDYGYGERVYVDVSELWHVVSLKAIAFDQWRSNQLGGSLVTERL